jgi:hypothetical protein
MTSTIGKANETEGQEALRRLALREEVLEICYWFQGEGFGDRFTAESLKTFLNGTREEILEALESLAAEAALIQDGASYSFSPEGKKHAGRLFHETFTEFQLGTHGECTAGCCDSEDDCDQDQTPGHTHLLPKGVS